MTLQGLRLPNVVHPPELAVLQGDHLELDTPGRFLKIDEAGVVLF